MRVEVLFFLAISGFVSLISLYLARIYKDHMGTCEIVGGVCGAEVFLSYFVTFFNEFLVIILVF